MKSLRYAGQYIMATIRKVELHFIFYIQVIYNGNVIFVSTTPLNSELHFYLGILRIHPTSNIHLTLLISVFIA